MSDENLKSMKDLYFIPLPCIVICHFCLNQLLSLILWPPDLQLLIIGLFCILLFEHILYILLHLKVKGCIP